MNGAWNTVSAQRYTSGESGAVRHKQRKPKQAERGADAGSSAGIRGNYRLGIAWEPRQGGLPGIKTGAVEVGIYIRADSAAEAALCWGLRVLRPCGSRADLYCLWVCGFATLVQQKFRLAPFSGTLFCPVVIGRTGSRGFIGKRMDLYWSRSGWRLEFQWPRTAQRLGG